MAIKKALSVFILAATAVVAMFCFNYTPVQPVYGPAVPTVAPTAVPTQPIAPETVAPGAQTPGVTPTAPVAAPAMVITNQAAIDAAKSSALYTQVLLALVLLLGSAFLMFARKYENPLPARLAAIGIAVAGLLFAAGLILMEWVPSESFPVSAGLLAITAAVAGPILQLMAPSEHLLAETAKTLKEVQALKKDLGEAEEELDEFETEVEDLKGKLETSEATAKSSKESLAKAETDLQAAAAAQAVAEKTSADALEARQDAEAEAAAAVAEAETLRERTATAEQRSAGVQVRLNAFEERKDADLAAAAADNAEATLAAAKQHVVSLQGELGTAQTDAQRLQTDHAEATTAADSAWESVESAAKVAIETESALATTQKQIESSRAAIADGVEVVDADALEQKLTTAETTHGEALEKLADLKQEARNADIAVGRLASEVASIEIKVSDLASSLEEAKVSVETATIAVTEAKKIADVAEIEAVAAERRFAALVAAEKQSATLTTQLATEQAENASLMAQNEELKDAVKDALHASGCVLSLNRYAADEEVAYYRVNLLQPQSEEIVVGIHIVDDEGEETLFRAIPAGENRSESFEIDRGYNAKIKILPPGQTAEALGTSEVVPFLVA